MADAITSARLCRLRSWAVRGTVAYPHAAADVRAALVELDRVRDDNAYLRRHHAALWRTAMAPEPDRRLARFAWSVGAFVGAVVTLALLLRCA